MFGNDRCFFFSLQLVRLASQDLPRIMAYLLRMGAILLQLATVCNAVVDQGVGSKSADYMLSISFAVILVCRKFWSWYCWLFCSLYCMPASLAVSCSSMQCKNSNLMLGNVTIQQTGGGCNVTSCNYGGLVNGTIITTWALLFNFLPSVYCM